MNYAIETQGLTKRFRSGSFLKRKQTIALNSVNLQVRPGDLFVLVGQNGAGKTTLLKILCGLVLPTSGNVYINGENIFNNCNHFRKDIAFVSGEERSFYWRLTGRQNLEFFARLYGLSKNETRNRMCELIETLDLKEEINKEFRYFSAGTKQRLALLRALLHNPSVIFMDEPTRSLDPLAQQKLRHFLRHRLRKEEGKTLFLTTHNLNEAEQLADRLAIIVKGEIKICNSVGGLKNKFGCEELEVVFGNVIKDTGLDS